MHLLMTVCRSWFASKTALRGYLPLPGFVFATLFIGGTIFGAGGQVAADVSAQPGSPEVVIPASKTAVSAIAVSAPATVKPFASETAVSGKQDLAPASPASAVGSLAIASHNSNATASSNPLAPRATDPSVSVHSSPLTASSNLPASKLLTTDAVSSAPPMTLLDEVGRLQRLVPAMEPADWKRELKTTHSAAVRAAWLHLWLGEWELAQNEQPQKALWHFRQAQLLTNPHHRCFGLAAYDRAITLFFEGAYGSSEEAFASLLTHKGASPGYDPRNCALWCRHASACAGYHAGHAKLGIPEPPQLDPLCGAAALAACLQSLSVPCNRSVMLKVCRVTGEGSSLGDLVIAAKRLGMITYSLSADDRALIALPKPMVAYVEGDHFVALTRADAKGISYLCSDCGAWPGGRVDLTWAQWHALGAGPYLILARPASATDNLLRVALAPTAKSPASADPLRLSYAGSLTALHLGMHFPGGLSLALRGHIARYIGLGPACAQKPDSLHCQDYIDAPMYGPGGTGQGPQECDPVNLATGEEEYTPPPDLVVYNPHGPAISFSRIYNSLRAPDLTQQGRLYDSSEFGVGWSFSYNYRIYDTNYSGDPNFTAASHTVQFIAPNGAITSISGKPSTATGFTPCTVPNGVPFTAEWQNLGNGNYQFIVTLTDRTKWFFTGAPVTAYNTVVPDNSLYVLTRITDSNNNSLHFEYWPETNTTKGALAKIYGDGTNAAGLSLTRSPNTADGQIDSISDNQGRLVWYHDVSYNNTVPHDINAADKTFVELDQVSRVVSSSLPVNTGNPFYSESVASTFYPSASRYTYGYQLVQAEAGGSNSYATLHSITVPSPASAATSLTGATAYINYNASYVASLTDANKNTTTFTPSGGSTKVAVTDASKNLLYSYTVGFDATMSQTTKTDGTNSTVVQTRTYANTDDPYRPISIKNGNSNGSNNIWSFVWDRYGNLHKVTSPRNTVTNYTWTFRSGYQPTTVNSLSSTTAPVLGELSSMQRGSKSPTAYTYYDAPSPYGSAYQDSTNSGLMHTLVSPQPNQVGQSGRVTSTFTYGPYGDLTAAATPGNNATSSNGTAIDQGITTQYNYDQDLGDSTHNIASYAPTSASYGQPLTATDGLGHVTHFRYTQGTSSTLGLGYPIAVIDALGFETDYSRLEPGQSTPLGVQPQRVTYPATGQTGSGRSYKTFTYLYVGGPLISTNLYDESGNLVRQANYTYGSEGELKSVTGSTEPVAYTYDALYRIHTLQDGNGHLTSYYYNTAGYLDSMTYPGYTGAAFPNVSGPDSIRFTYDAGGNIATRTDGNGVITTYDHTTDPESLLKSVQYSYPQGYTGTQIANISYQYDGYSRLTSMSDGTSSTVLGPNGAPGYDDLDNPINIQTNYTGLPGRQVQYSYWYDGSRSTMYLPNAGQFYYSYDKAHRLIGLKNPFNEQTSWNYFDNDWLQSQSDGNGAGGTALSATDSYNSLGQLLDLKNSNAITLFSEFGGANQSAGVSHNAAGDTTTVPVGASATAGSTTYQYDNGQATAQSRGQLTQETTSRPGGLNNNFAYDTAGNPTVMRGVAADLMTADNQPSLLLFDGNGNSSTRLGASLTFDAMNRLTTVAPQAASLPTQVAVGGDGVTRILWRNANGSLTVNTLSNSGAVVSAYTYGPYTGWTGIALAAGPNGVPRLLWAKSDGSMALWSLDSSGGFTHNEFGPYTGWTAKALAIGPDNLAHILWTHAPDGQVSLWTVNADATFTHADYTLFAGTPASVCVDTANTVHILWSDRSTGQATLTTANSNSTFTTNEIYGPYAGWSAQTLTAGPASDNRLHIIWNNTGGKSSVWTINVDGSFTNFDFGPYAGWMALQGATGPDNVTRLLWRYVDGSASLWTVDSFGSYNIQPTLTPARLAGTGATFSYRGDGLRAWKQVNGATTYFLYDGSSPVCEMDSNGNILSINTFGANGLVSRRNGASSIFYAFDERGNVAQRVDANANVTSQDLYDAYGAKLAGANDVFGFGGQSGYYTDAETGLLLLTHRYYDPATGRFLTRDPLGYAGGINLYSYVTNNPINMNDPLGLCGSDDAEPGFWDAVGSGLNVGLNATASALSFNLYNGGSARCDPSFSTSKKLAGYGRDALIMAATAGTGSEAVAAEEAEGTAVESASEGAESIGEGCLRCFTAGTLVQMADGTTKPIERVQPGDRVRSRDPRTGQESAKTVTAAVKRFAPAVVTVSLRDAATGRVETLTCTPEHPFFVPGAGWVEAGSLGIGTSLVTRAGPQLSVQSVIWHRDTAAQLAAQGGVGSLAVYNLTVEDDHTFFVGSTGGGTWVHNTPCTGETFPETPEEMSSMMGKAGVKPGGPSQQQVWEFTEEDGSLSRFRYEKHLPDANKPQGLPHEQWHYHYDVNGAPNAAGRNIFQNQNQMYFPGDLIP